MRISLIDASEYFRGLLLLSRKDHKVTEGETELMKRIGKAFGFEKEFCENAIVDILENQFVSDTPPKFSTSELAARFVKDGLTLAFSDKEVAMFEAEWLRATAEKNGLDLREVVHEWSVVANRGEVRRRLEVDDMTVEHS